MARRKPAPRPKHVERARTSPASGTTEHSGAALTIAAAVLIIASQWLVDPRAEAAFDAPKRLVTLVGAVVALAMLGPRAIGAAATAAPRHRGSVARAALGLAVVTLGWALVAALTATRTRVAFGGWRVIALSAPLVAIGAARALDGRGERVLLGTFWTASAVTALLSLAQRLAGLTLFQIEQLGGRAHGIALVGNEGLIGLVMALAATSAAAVLWRPGPVAGSTDWRAPGVMLALAVSALAASGNLTGLLALAAGVSVVAVLRFGARAIASGVGVLVALGVVALVVPPLAHRVTETLRAVGHGDWNGVLTYRPVAWRAALAMVRAEPWTGNGPGTFEADFVPFRLAAEVDGRARLAHPELTGHFASAHDEYLEAFASTGVPGGLLALATLVALLAGSAARCIRPRESGADLLRDRLAFATLVCGAVAALTWFPLQAAATRVPLLLAAGRAWRGLERDAPELASAAAPPRAARPLGVAILVALGLLALPELPRYWAEHVTYRVRAQVGALFAPGARPPSPALVATVGTEAAFAARWIPGDARALSASAAAALVARDGRLALDRYRLAAAQGERAELDLNVGRAHAILDQRAAALAAFVRAIWLAPVLAPELPEAARPLVADEITRREALLASGAADALPPWPPPEAP
ncbi:MAG: O-antigen ligase family protein [Deltaproteobacteria bacterium]|nr:O-antigen ligase family protein [Deltaproteobacteria bacterium]